MSDLFDLTGICGETNLPGVATTCYYICRDDIESFPPFMTYVAPGDSLRLEGDIVMKATKKMYRHEIVSSTGMLQSTLVGEQGSQVFDNVFEGRYKKTDAKTLEFVERVKDGCGILIIKELTGDYRVIGNMDTNAQVIEAQASSGMKTGDSRGTTIKFKDEIGRPAPFYTGDFDITA